MSENSMLRRPFDPPADPVPAELSTPGDTPILTLLRGRETDVDWAGRAALAIGRCWGTEGGSVLVVDACFENPILDQLTGAGPSEGLADLLLYGSSIRRVARPASEGDYLVVGTGTPVVDTESLFTHEGWGPLIDAFRDAGAALLILAPEEGEGVSELLGRTDAVVRLGGDGDVGAAPILATLDSSAVVTEDVSTPDTSTVLTEDVAPVEFTAGALFDAPGAGADGDEQADAVEEPEAEPVEVDEVPLPDPVDSVDPVALPSESHDAPDDELLADEPSGYGTPAEATSDEEPDEGDGTEEMLGVEAVEVVDALEPMEAVEPTESVESGEDLELMEEAAGEFRMDQFPEPELQGERGEGDEAHAELNIGGLGGDRYGGQDLDLGGEPEETGEVVSSQPEDVPEDLEAEEPDEGDDEPLSAVWDDEPLSPEWGEDDGVDAEDDSAEEDLPQVVSEEVAPDPVGLEESTSEEVLAPTGGDMMEGVTHGADFGMEDEGPASTDASVEEQQDDQGWDAGTVVPPEAAEDGGEEDVGVQDEAPVPVHVALPGGELEVREEKKLSGLEKLARKRKWEALRGVALRGILIATLLGGALYGAGYMGLIEIPYVTPPERRGTTPVSEIEGPVPVGPVLSHALFVDSWRTLETPQELIPALRSRLPGILFYVTPLLVDGRTQFALMAGPTSTVEEAESLRAPIAGVLDRQNPEDWRVMETSLVFMFGDYGGRNRAAARVRDLAEMAIPAYLLEVEFEDGSLAYRVYGGGYADEFEAQGLKQFLTAEALREAPLVQRRGRRPE